MSEEPIPTWALHRRLYEWVLGFAATSVAPAALFFIAVIEAFIPFVPPDALLIPMCVEKRSKSALFAAIAVIGSLIGAIIAYFMIALLFHHAAMMFEDWIWVSNAYTDLIETMVREFETRGGAYVFIAALTPVPFFAFTTAAGVAKFNFGIFIAACTIGRSLRYGLVALITYWIGQKAKMFIDKWFNAITIIACVVLLLGWYVSTKL